MIRDFTYVGVVSIMKARRCPTCIGRGELESSEDGMIAMRVCKFCNGTGFKNGKQHKLVIVK